MKILMINSVCGIRSTGRICTDLAEKFIAEGNEVKIAYGREDVPDKYKSISVRIGNDNSVYLSGLKSRLLDNEGFNCASQTEKFLKWADEYNPDLLWLHNLHGYYLNVELLFKWIKSRPDMKVKWTLHDCWPFTGHCAYFTMAKCEKWKTQCSNCVQKKVYPSSLFADKSAGNYKRKKEVFSGVKNMVLITPSQWLADLVKQSFLKNYPVEVVNNTVNTEVFKPRKSDFRKIHGLQDKKIVLCVASAWGKAKGLQDVLKLSEFLDDRYKLVLVGLTSKQNKGIPSDILVIERTNNAVELAEIYTAADVFVNPTHQDNYPTVNLEARACGTPVITYNVGGSPESAGYEHIVEENDISGLFNKIKEVVG